MGSGFSAQQAIAEASEEDVVAVIAELSPEERKNLEAALPLEPTAPPVEYVIGDAEEVHLCFF